MNAWEKLIQTGKRYMKMYSKIFKYINFSKLKFSKDNSQTPSLTTDAVVLRKHKKDNSYDILMIKRGRNPYKGHLAFPGGFVDYNEDPIEGCLRELKEECDLDGTSIEFVIKSINN
jgi:hypothetical protein